MNRFFRIFDYILNVFVVIAGIILIFMMLSTCGDVVMRYFFNRPSIWVIDVTSFSMLFMAFLVAAWVLKNEGHVRIDLIVNMLSPRGQLWLTGVMSIITALTFLLITWYSANLTWNLYLTKFEVNSVMRPLKYPLFFIIPLGFLALSIQLIRRTIQCFTKLRAPQLDSQETTKAVKSEEGV